MTMSRAAGRTRATIFAPRIDELLRRYGGADLFRLEPGIIGIAGAGLMDTILRSSAASTSTSCSPAHSRVAPPAGCPASPRDPPADTPGPAPSPEMRNARHPPSEWVADSYLAPGDTDPSGGPG